MFVNLYISFALVAPFVSGFSVPTTTSNQLWTCSSSCSPIFGVRSRSFSLFAKAKKKGGKGKAKSGSGDSGGSGEEPSFVDPSASAPPISGTSVKELASSAQLRMGKSVEALQQNLQTIRTGRANAAILDRVVVVYFDVPTPLNQLAGISVPSSSQLTIEPYDKSALADIEKALIESSLGLNPNNDGNVIRLNIPQLTEERRKELTKQVKSLGEDGKVSIRNIRRQAVDGIKKLEKSSDISKDQSMDAQDDMQKMTDASIKNMESALDKKEKDVMKV